MDDAQKKTASMEQQLQTQVRSLALQLSTYREVTAEYAGLMHRERIAHEKRVSELLEANNRYLERARDAETALAAALATIPEASHV